MAFNRPTLQELIDRIYADISVQVSSGVAVLRRSVLGVMGSVWAGAAHLLHGHLDYNSRQFLPDTSDEENTIRIGNLYGVTRKTAAFAAGQVTFTGVDASVIPAETAVQRTDGVQFLTDEAGTIVGGAAVVPVTAATAGADANTLAGTLMTLTSPVSGVNATAVAGELSGGADEETIEDLRARVLDRIRRPPQGGAIADYRQWALSVPGVRKVWIFPEFGGSGTVGVAIGGDERTDTHLADSETIQAVIDYIQTVRPVTAQVFVFAPELEPVDFTISLIPDGTTIRQAVEAELSDFFDREAAPMGGLPLSRINEAISSAAGEYDHILVTPNSGLIASYGKISSLGTITWL